MKVVKTHILLFLICLSSYSFSQNTNVKGYRMDGDEVVFTFKPSDYNKLKHDSGDITLELDEVNINNVFVAGEFNDWSRNRWKMVKVNDSIYELRKKMSDFIDEFDWEFKFIINSTYWAEPDESTSNIAHAKSIYGKPLHAYNLKMYTAFASESGNANFRLKGYHDATNVILSGTFNRWDESVFQMKKTDYGWELTLQLKPDLYEYKFIVDGEWMEDPNNPSKKKNEYHGYNSLIDIQKEIAFELCAYENAKTVILSGDFNDWSWEKYKMEKTPNGWRYTINLSRGKYHYKFIVDGEWIIDPGNSVVEYDSMGNINSVCMVK